MKCVDMTKKYFTDSQAAASNINIFTEFIFHKWFHCSGGIPQAFLGVCNWAGQEELSLPDIRVSQQVRNETMKCTPLSVDTVRDTFTILNQDVVEMVQRLFWLWFET